MRLLPAFLIAGFLFASPAAWSAEIPPQVRRSLQWMNNGYLLEAYHELSAYHAANPEDSLAGTVLALAKWKIMWISSYTASEKEELNGLLDALESKCAEKQEDEDCLFETSSVSAIRTQILATENQWWKAAQESKKMKSRAQRLLELNPEYYDGYYLLGSFNYFADALPGYVRFLRSLMFLPGGDRVAGMRQLVLSYQKGRLASGEAGRTLALIYIYYEKRFDYGLRMCDTLLQSYPDNLEIALYKGVALYFSGQFAESESWLRALHHKIVKYSSRHAESGETETITPVYRPMGREVNYWIARCLIQQNRGEEAEKILTELAVPEIHQPYWLLRGVNLSLAQLDYQRGDNALAEKHLASVMRWPDLKDSRNKARNLRKKKNKIGRFDLDLL